MQQSRTERLRPAKALLLISIAIARTSGVTAWGAVAMIGESISRLFSYVTSKLTKFVPTILFSELRVKCDRNLWQWPNMPVQVKYEKDGREACGSRARRIPERVALAQLRVTLWSSFFGKWT